MATHEVQIKNMKFNPTPVNIQKGDSVVWSNEDNMPHTATADDKKWDTGRIAPKTKSKPIAFANPGDSPYHCTIHPNMKGVVKAAG